MKQLPEIIVISTVINAKRLNLAFGDYHHQSVVELIQEARAYRTYR